MANLPFGSMGIKLSYQAQIALCKKKDLRTMRRPLRFGNKFFYFKNSQKIDFVAEGVGDTAMPASSRALILSSAEPEFPETIAPACPILLHLGAVRPAMNAATGFLQFSFSYAAAFCSPPPFYVYAKLLIGLY